MCVKELLVKEFSLKGWRVKELHVKELCVTKSCVSSESAECSANGARHATPNEGRCRQVPHLAQQTKVGIAKAPRLPRKVAGV